MSTSKGTYAVIGLGQFGSAIARSLQKRGAEVIAIDIDEGKVDDIKKDVSIAVTLDSTQKEALLAHDIDTTDAVLICIGDLNHFNNLLLTTFTVQELGVKRIIVRAQGEAQKRILQKMGITEVLCPEDEVSSNVSERLLNPSVVMYVELPDRYEIVEVHTPYRAIGHTLGEISLRKKYHLNLITLLRKSADCDDYHIVGVPTADTRLCDTDLILLFGKGENIKRFIEVNS